MASWREVFPDFTDMPAIPDSWLDVSWGNDACPSFLTRTGLQVFVDYKDPAERELLVGHRFYALNEHTAITLFETDDWAAMLEFVKTGTTSAPAG